MLCCSPSRFAGQHRCLFCIGIYRQVCQQFVQERFTAKTAFGSRGAIDAVNQFGQSDRRERRILIAGGADNPLNQPFDSFSASFRINNHAGVEDQSHASGLSGSRWLSMAASTSLAKSGSSVAVEPCSRASRRDSDSRRTLGSA